MTKPIEIPAILDLEKLEEALDWAKLTHAFLASQESHEMMSQSVQTLIMLGEYVLESNTPIQDAASTEENF